jgi:hypothetical protein
MALPSDVYLQQPQLGHLKSHQCVFEDPCNRPSSSSCSLCKQLDLWSCDCSSRTSPLLLSGPSLQSNGHGLSRLGFCLCSYLSLQHGYFSKGEPRLQGGLSSVCMGHTTTFRHDLHTWLWGFALKKSRPYVMAQAHILIFSADPI